MLFRKKFLAGVEHRQDPLMGAWTRINPERAARVKHTGEELAGEDLRRLTEASRANCPFCPERREASTPVFGAELFGRERLRQGQCVLFPNKSPFGENHAVGILTDDHYRPMGDFTEKILLDALEVSQEYFLALNRREPSSRYPVYVWNFLPPAAGSIVHPHIQLLLESRPAPLVEQLTAKCMAWQKTHGQEYWTTLVREEARLGSRVIQMEETLTVLASFAPRGFREVLLVLPGSASLAELRQPETEAFCRALILLLRGYETAGVGSFNLVTYSPPLHAAPPPFPFHAKLISRPYPSGIYTNDTGFCERMYDLWIIDTPPEDTAARLRPFFQGKTAASQD